MKITRKEIVTLEVESSVFDSIMFIISRGSQGTLLDPIDIKKAEKSLIMFVASWQLHRLHQKMI